MKIQTHRELIVWQKAMDIAMRVFEVTRAFPVEERYSLTDQMRRTFRSVAAQIQKAGAAAGIAPLSSTNSTNLKGKPQKCKRISRLLSAAVISSLKLLPNWTRLMKKSSQYSSA